VRTIKPRIATLGQGFRRASSDGKLWRPDAERGTAAQRGYGHAWRKLREVVMHRDGGLCQACAERGLVTRATEVDHIVPKSQGGSDDESNLRALCRACHDEKSRREMAQGRP
jgi:5-methylcytosine-specific restriction protein A